MKGIYGLCVAAALGIAGALFNFAYLAKKAQQVENVVFIGVKDGAVINRGEPIQADRLCQVPIPAAVVGNVQTFGVPWGALQTTVGIPAWRTLAGPRLLLQEDLKMPPPEQLTLNKDEHAQFVNVDPRAFVPSLVCPGDKIYFYLPEGASAGPTPAVRPGDPSAAGEGGEEPAPVKTRPGKSDLIGPFKVLSIGNRLGTVDVMRAAKVPISQENVIVIRVSEKEPGEMERAAKLRSPRPWWVWLDEQAPRQRETP